jgi:hypothetical protein
MPKKSQINEYNDTTKMLEMHIIQNFVLMIDIHLI